MHNIALYSCVRNSIIWEDSIDYRRAVDCRFFDKYLIMKFLTPKKLKIDKIDKYSLLLISKIGGEVLFTLPKVEDFQIVNDTLYIKQNNVWLEYEIENN